LSATPAGDEAGNQGHQGFSTGGQISGDGRVIIFESTASNLASQSDINNANDIFSVGAPQAPPIAAVPTLSGAGLALLALLTAGLGLRAVRK